MKSVKFTLFCALLLCLSAMQPAYGQNGVAIAATTATADPSAMLDVQSTSKGALVPRMSTTQRTGISSPATGLLVYDLTVPGFFYYNGTAWVQISAGALSGSGTTGYDAYWTGGTSLGSGNIYNSGTSVGIGTTSNINQTLTILNSSGVYSNNEGQTSGLGILTGTTSSDYILYMGADKTNHLSYIQSVQWGTATTKLALNARGGNVGIGTASPSYPLDVAGDINTNTGFTISGAATSGNYLRGNGTNFVSSAIQAADMSAFISGTTNYHAKFTGTNTIGSSSVIYESGTAIGINNTSPTGAGISFTTSGGGTTNNIAWGAGPYSSIYDNANIHYWTDDVTNFESGSTGSSAVWNWVAGQTKTGTGGSNVMSLSNGALTVNNLAQTVQRPVIATTGGVLTTAPSCPSGYTAYNSTYKTLCLMTASSSTAGNTSSFYWPAAELYCNGQSGGDLCSFAQVTRACAAGYTLGNFSGYWLMDKSGDDTFIYDNTNSTGNCSVGNGLNNFDGVWNRTTNGLGAFCCIEYDTH
jgi:hypothetical protein